MNKKSAIYRVHQVSENLFAVQIQCRFLWFTWWADKTWLVNGEFESPVPFSKASEAEAWIKTLTKTNS